MKNIEKKNNYYLISDRFALTVENERITLLHKNYGTFTPIVDFDHSEAQKISNIIKESYLYNQKNFFIGLNKSHFVFSKDFVKTHRLENHNYVFVFTIPDEKKIGFQFIKTTYKKEGYKLYYDKRDPSRRFTLMAAGRLIQKTPFVKDFINKNPKASKRKLTPYSTRYKTAKDPIFYIDLNK